jgi:uracil DNA glycosylase
MKISLSLKMIEALDFLMGYESYLRKRRISGLKWAVQTDWKTSSPLLQIFYRLRADISKDTAHERIQTLYTFSISTSKFMPS